MTVVMPIGVQKQGWFCIRGIPLILLLLRLPELLLVEKLLLDVLLGLLSMAAVMTAVMAVVMTAVMAVVLCVRRNTCQDGEHRAGT